MTELALIQTIALVVNCVIGMFQLMVQLVKLS
jgi:hypothetical protein